MDLKIHSSYNNSSRHKIRLNFSNLFKNNKLLKNLNLNLSKGTGRSTNTGRITVRHIGNRCQVIYKKKQMHFVHNQISIVLGYIYDPNHNNFLCMNFDLLKKRFFYSSALSNVYPGSILSWQQQCTNLYLGYNTIIKSIPVGSKISNIISKKSPGILVASAGTYATLIQKQKNNFILKVPSSVSLKVPINTVATLGANSNSNFNQQYFGKAGYTRLKGTRPTVRGVVMNPVDHPHGGRTKGGFHPVSPWGKRN